MADTTLQAPADRDIARPGAENLVGTNTTPILTGEALEQYATTQVQQPGLAPGTEQASIDIQEKPGELLAGTTADVTTPTTKIATTTPTATVSDQNLANMLNITPETVQAYAATGVTGTVTPESLLRFQMKQYMGDVESGEAPWADAAIRKANELMLQRGMGASTMAGAAISQAILEAAAPLAQYDANVFGQMNIQNVRNQQEAMLSTAGAENAARQFNAQNSTEVDKFMAQLRDQTYRFNAEQSNSMSRFNADQENSVNMFYDKMQNETDKFVAENKVLIERSNVEWRRAINTANTAAQNAALQQNVQNRFNVSQQQLAELWQRSRDVFDWANKNSENAKDRAYNLTMYNMKRSDFLRDVKSQDKKNFWKTIGGLAADIVGDASKSLLDSWLGG